MRFKVDAPVAIRLLPYGVCNRAGQKGGCQTDGVCDLPSAQKIAEDDGCKEVTRSGVGGSLFRHLGAVTSGAAFADDARLIQNQIDHFLFAGVPVQRGDTGDNHGLRLVLRAAIVCCGDGLGASCMAVDGKQLLSKSLCVSCRLPQEFFVGSLIEQAEFCQVRRQNIRSCRKLSHGGGLPFSKGKKTVSVVSQNRIAEVKGFL